MVPPPPFYLNWSRYIVTHRDSQVAQMVREAWTGQEAVPPKALPALAVDDVLEHPAVGVGHRLEPSAGGEAERDEDRALPILGQAEDAAGEVLVADRGVAAPDPQVGRGEHDRHRHLPDVVQEGVALVPVLGGGYDEDDRGRGRSDVGGVPPGPRQLAEPIAIRDDHEVPAP